MIGKKRSTWYDKKYVLGYFGNNQTEAKRNYLSYVKKAIDQGRRPELVGGGLVRSLGGWSEVAAKSRFKPGIYFVIGRLKNWGLVARKSPDGYQ